MNLELRLEVIKNCISNALSELDEARMDINYIIQNLNQQKTKGKKND